MELGFNVPAFGLPAALLLMGLTGDVNWPWIVAPLLQAPGLVAERWFFFAQAQHHQNLYYQAVS